MRQNSLGVTSSPLELNIPTSMWEEKTPSSAELLALECEGLHVTVPSVAALWEPWLPGIPCPPPQRIGEDMECLAGVPPLRQIRYLKPRN